MTFIAVALLARWTCRAVGHKFSKPDHAVVQLERVPPIFNTTYFHIDFFREFEAKQSREIIVRHAAYVFAVIGNE